jgi:tetratricopeptide (TPR) repeat protein
LVLAATVSEITPPVSSRYPPPLWQIGEYEFQNLTVELLAREPDLKAARLHGGRGYGQFGVDAIAEIRDGGKAAASCKCSEDASVALIKKACEEFDQHKRRWKQEDCRRFFVVVAGYADAPKVQQEETKQKRRYKGRGILFELWDGTIIVQKIGPHPELVHKYLRSDTWQSILCGPQYAPPGYVPSATKDAEASRLREYLAESTSREIESLRAALRRGHRAEVGDKLTALRRNRSLWSELTPEIQASALRLQAGLALDMGNVDEAESLVAEAAALCTTEGAVGLRMRIRLQKLGPEEALATLPPGDGGAESLCARGSLLLVLGRLDEAALALEAAYDRKPDDVDAVRLLALIAVMRGDVPRALSLVEESIRLAGDWEIVRRTRAVIFYLSALSSAQLQSPACAIPDAIDWAFVRRDDESARRLADAAEVFRRMAEDPDRPLADRQTLEIWWLACLANLPAENATAAETCARLISKHPCNIYAVPWAMVRDYAVDFPRAAAIAEQSIEAMPTNVGPILVVIACSVRVNDHAAAKEILSRHRARFESQHLMEIWNHWWMVVLLMSGDAQGALEFGTSVSDRGRPQHVEVAALLQQARQSHDSAHVKELLDSLYGSTGDPRYLMLWAGQQAFEGNWTAISEKARELLRAVPTPDALYLVLTADFETRAYDRCLSRIEEFRGLFPGSGLPLDVKRLRVGCFERSGKPRDALREADALRREDGSTSTLGSFTRLCIGYGDVQTAITAAHELAGRDDMLAEDAVSIAELLSPHAPQLSRQLLRGAKAQSIPEGRIFKALNLGQYLAIEHEQSELRKRVEILAAQEGSTVRVMTEKDVLTLLTQAQQACHEILGLYERGLKPVHEAMDRCGFNVAPLLSASHGGTFRPFEQPRFFVFHGKRASLPPVSIPCTAPRLNLDVTTVFLIHRLSLWDPIEQAFAEIRCSHLIVPLLNQILSSTMSAQPQFEDALAEVCRLYRDGRVHADTGEDNGSRNEMDSDRVDARLAEELRFQGLLTETEYAKAIESLPSADGQTGAAIPDMGSRVRCSRAALVLLATSGTLGAFAKAFHILIDKAVAASVEADVSAIEERHTAAESIRHLIGALGERFKGGKLKTLPEAAPGPRFGTLALDALADLIGFPADSSDVICADDRFINGFDHRGEEDRVPIISLLDLLAMLAERGIIDRARIWQLRHALRAANCLFIPIEPDEIAHHLINAATGDGNVIETPELGVIRQYMAACFAQGGVLQRASPPANAGEIGFAIGLRKAVVEALALLWGDESQSDEARMARANWLIESLYIDYLGICRSLGIKKPPDEERQLVAMAGATLMVLDMESGGPKEGNKDARYEYKAWIWNSLFRRRCNADPSLLSAVAKCIGLNLFLIANQKEPEDLKDRGLLKAAMLRIAAALPDPLRSLVQDDITARPGFEEGMRRVFKVEDLEFDAAAYMRQVASALSNGSATVQALRTKEDVIIRRLQIGNWDAIDLERPLQRKVHRLGNALWGALLESAPDREAALRRHSRLFDMEPEEFERLLRSVGGTEDPFGRIEAAAAAAKRSLPFFYHTLEQRVQLNEPLAGPDLMADSEIAFLRYYGIKEESAQESGALATERWPEVERRVGPIQATVRLAALPVPLPANLEAAFRSAAPDQQKKFLHAVLRAGPSPTHHIHALRLAFLAAPTPALQHLRRRLVRQHLGSAGRDERTAFLSVLEFVTEAFDNWHLARPWDGSLRLMFSWAHAGHLFAMYRRAHAPLGWIAEVFHRPRAYQALTDLEEEFIHGKDAATPDLTTPDRIAVSGLAYALSPDSLPLPNEATCEAKRQWFVDSGAPHARFLEMPSRRPNAMGSFLGRDHMEDLRALLGERLIGDYGTAWRSRLHEQAMAAIGSEPQQSSGWIFLAALYGNGPTPGEAASQIEDTLKLLDFREVVERDRGNQHIFLLTIANRIAHVTREETRIAITSSLIRLAEWYGSHSGTEAEAADLLNLVLAHAYPAAGRPSTMAEFQQLCLNVAKTFPKFAGSCRYTIDRVCHDLPIERSADYWPLALALRAIDDH